MMIVNNTRTKVLSSLGWVDGGSLWCFDVRSGKAESIAIGTGASHLSLHPGDDNHFSIAITSMERN